MAHKYMDKSFAILLCLKLLFIYSEKIHINQSQLSWGVKAISNLHSSISAAYFYITIPLLLLTGQGNLQQLPMSDTSESGSMREGRATLRWQTDLIGEIPCQNVWTVIMCTVVRWLDGGSGCGGVWREGTRRPITMPKPKTKVVIMFCCRVK